jgi:hypothetical protein
VQSKIQSLAGQHSDVLESLTPVVRKRVEVLREIQVYSLNFYSFDFDASFCWLFEFLNVCCFVVYLFNLNPHVLTCLWSLGSGTLECSPLKVSGLNPFGATFCVVPVRTEFALALNGSGFLVPLISRSLVRTRYILVPSSFFCLICLMCIIYWLIVLLYNWNLSNGWEI